MENVTESKLESDISKNNLDISKNNLNVSQNMLDPSKTSVQTNPANSLPESHQFPHQDSISNSQSCICSHFCCCGISLLSGTKFIVYYSIIAWVCFGISLIATLSKQGGTDWMPGYKEKYLSLLTFIGYSIEALGALTAWRSNFSKIFIGKWHVFLKIGGLVVVQAGNIGTLITQPLLIEISGGGYTIFVIGIIIWISLDIYFICILRSYFLETEESIHPTPENAEIYRIPSNTNSFPDYPPPEFRPPMVVWTSPNQYPTNNNNLQNVPPPIGYPVGMPMNNIPMQEYKKEQKFVYSPNPYQNEKK